MQLLKKDDKDLAILVGGAGFTGIEFLGELTERIPELCSKYGIDQSKVKLLVLRLHLKCYQCSLTNLLAML